MLIKGRTSTPINVPTINLSARIIGAISASYYIHIPSISTSSPRQRDHTIWIMTKECGAPRTTGVGPSRAQAVTPRRHKKAMGQQFVDRPRIFIHSIDP